MKRNARRACASALLVLALALFAAAPAFATSDGEALPAFDDNDDSDGVAAVVLPLWPAVLPSATPLFDAPSFAGSHERVLEHPAPDDATSGRLASRAPPRS